MANRALRHYASFNALVLSLLFALPALEALLLRREVTLAARQPLALLAFAYVGAGVLVHRLDDEARASPLRMVATVAGSFATLLIGSFVSRQLLDTSWDGLMYHQPAIYELHEGWNPYTRSLDLALSTNNLWINEYPRAAWYASSVLLGVFADVDAAKLSFFLGSTTLAAALRVARAYQVSLRWRGLVAASLAVLNPVVIVQFWQFYLDGVLYYALLLCMLSALAYAREQRALDLVVLVAVGTFLGNVKFTGPLYFLAVLGWLGADQLRWGRVWRPTALALASWLAAMALTGFNPYLSHLLDGKHMLHPVYGKEAADVVGPYVPGVLAGRSWLKQLLYSYVGFASGKFDWLRVAQELALDGVGTIGENRVDPRVAGFGRYFWLSWSFAALAAVATLLRLRSLRLAFAVVCLLVLGVLNPSAWWARYVPQLWVVPLLLGLLSLSVRPRPMIWLPVGLAFYLQAVCAQLYLGQSWWLQLSLSRTVAQERTNLVAQLAEAEQVRVGATVFGAHYFWLKAQGLPVKRQPEAAVQCAHPIEALKMKLCVEP